MKFQILGASHFENQPWKNGGGSTTELYKIPNQGVYELRLSLATVDKSGPFSLFEGYKRTIIQLEGEPMRLFHSELARSKTLQRLQPYHFDGAWQTQCEVTTRARDFNVIFKRGMSFETHADILGPSVSMILDGLRESCILYCFKGGLEVSSSLRSVNIGIGENELGVLSHLGEREALQLIAGQSGASFVLLK